jgi:PKHD-type hydroxylase
MNIKPLYVFKAGHFTPDFCDRVIMAGEKLRILEGATLGLEGKLGSNSDVRDSKLAFFQLEKEYQWLFDAVLQPVFAANAQHWKFHIAACEPIQYTTYDTGQFYSWHVDQHSEPYPDGPFKGLTRKLSITIQLSEPDQYDGGDFEIRDYCDYDSTQTITGMRPRGSLLVFPSFLMHRVAPVTRGLRRSLVCWIVGPPFT